MSRVVLQLGALTPPSHQSLNRSPDWTETGPLLEHHHPLPATAASIDFCISSTGGETQLQAKYKLTENVTVVLIRGADYGLVGLGLQGKKTLMCEATRESMVDTTD